MRYSETPLFFDCAGSALAGVVSVPERPSRVGVVIVVGGPQYRVGSHRQFVLLARALASAGIACMRFDYRGMGDSEGPRITFDEAVPDIVAAAATLCTKVPAVERVVLWGLCDGAAACAFAAAAEPRVGGLALLNPWVRTEAGAATVQLRDYYRRRLLDGAFWRKLARGEVRFAQSLQDGCRTLWRRIAGAGARRDAASPDLPTQVAQGLERHRGPVLLVLSGRDAVAAEFRLAAEKNPLLHRALDRGDVTTVDVAHADHTFSSSHTRDEATRATLQWLRTCFPEELGS